MLLEQRAPLAILSCKSGNSFAKKVVKNLKQRFTENLSLTSTEEMIFANTEIKTIINESIRGKDVFIIQDVENHTEGMSVDENLRALYTMVDACRRCDAERVTAVLPSFPYARQDKQDGREGITAARIALELEGDMGFDHVLTIDLHNNAIQGFFRKAQIDNLRGSYVLIPKLKELIVNPEETIIMPTDLGGAKRANYYAQSLQTGIAFTYKKRDYRRANCVEEIAIMGDVEGKDVYIIDDMICTGGTLNKAISEAKKMGAREITAVCTLALFNDPAGERFKEAFDKGLLTKIIGTDATYHSSEFLKSAKWFEQVSVADYFAEIIFRVNTRHSIGELLK